MDDERAALRQRQSSQRPDMMDDGPTPHTRHNNDCTNQVRIRTYPGQG